MADRRRRGIRSHWRARWWQRLAPAALNSTLDLLAGPALCRDGCPLETAAGTAAAGAGKQPEPEHPAHRYRTEIVAQASREAVMGVLTAVTENLREAIPRLGVRFSQSQPAIVTAIACDR